MPKQPNNELLAVRIPESLLHRIQDCADARGAEFSDYVRDILRNGVKYRERKLRATGLLPPR